MQKRLQRELSVLLAELLDGHGSIARLLHLASDLHQTELLLDAPRPVKRMCQAWPGRQGPEEAAELLRALARAEGLATVRVELGEQVVDGPWLSTELPEPKGVRGGWHGARTCAKLSFRWVKSSWTTPERPVGSSGMAVLDYTEGSD